MTFTPTQAAAVRAALTAAVQATLDYQNALAACARQLAEAANLSAPAVTVNVNFVQALAAQLQTTGAISLSDDDLILGYRFELPRR